MGATAYSQIKDIDEVRFPEMIKAYIKEHKSINNAELRELLKLGDSNYAKVKASRLLKKLTGKDEFLEPQGTDRKFMRYIIREKNK